MNVVELFTGSEGLTKAIQKKEKTEINMDLDRSIEFDQTAVTDTATDEHRSSIEVLEHRVLVMRQRLTAKDETILQLSTENEVLRSRIAGFERMTLALSNAFGHISDDLTAATGKSLEELAGDDEVPSAAA